MRYVFLSTGSWERNPSMIRLRELGRELVARGVDVVYAVDDVPFNRSPGLGVDARATVVYSRAAGLAQLRARRRTIRQLRPDFVHVLNPSPKTCAALWGTRVRVVGDWDEWPALRPGSLPRRALARYLDRWMRRRPVVTLVSSKYMRDEFRARHGLDAVYLPYAAYMSDAVAGHSPFDRPTAVYMGALYPAYDHDVLFHAARVLKQRGQTPPITFIGDGPDIEKWRAFVRDHGLSNVTVKGYVSDDDRYLHLRHAHVLLFPIRTNPVNLARCPAKTFAYAQARRPVITCRVGEVPEVLGDAPTYIDPEPAPFADAIARAMSHDQPDVDYGVERQNWSARADVLLEALERIG
jgi:glycosyltransferase involved in cell wall biosynthesis